MCLLLGVSKLSTERSFISLYLSSSVDAFMLLLTSSSSSKLWAHLHQFFIEVNCKVPPINPIVAAATKLGIPLPTIIARMLRGKNSTTFPNNGAFPYHECLTRNWRLGRVAASPKRCMKGPTILLAVHIPLPLSLAAAIIVLVWTTLFWAIVATSSRAPMPVVRLDPKMWEKTSSWFVIKSFVPKRKLNLERPHPRRNIAYREAAMKTPIVPISKGAIQFLRFNFLRTRPCHLDFADDLWWVCLLLLELSPS